MSAPAPDDVPGRAAGDDETRALLEQLDDENERYLMVTIELRDLLEDAVTKEVAQERRADELAAQLGLVDAELTALRNTKLMRAFGPLRSLYGRWRTWRD